MGNVSDKVHDDPKINKLILSCAHKLSYLHLSDHEKFQTYLNGASDDDIFNILKYTIQNDCNLLFITVYNHL